MEIRDGLEKSERTLEVIWVSTRSKYGDFQIMTRSVVTIGVTSRAFGEANID